MYRAFCCGTLKEIDYLDNLRADTGIILKLSFRKYDRSVDCVGLAQGREK